MDFGNRQQVQADQTHVTADADALLNEMLSGQRKFRSEVIWADVSEVVTFLLILFMWFYLRPKVSLPWTWYLVALVIGWNVVLTVTYRMRHSLRPSELGEPLLHCVGKSLTQVENQIRWHRRNVSWKILPVFVVVVAFFVHIEWLKKPEDWSAILDSVGLLAGEISVSAFALVIPYSSNQHIVRSKLEPRRQALLSLLTGLTKENEQQPAGGLSAN